MGYAPGMPNYKNKTDNAMNERYLSRALVAGFMTLIMTVLPGCATKKPGEPLQTTPPAGADSAYDDQSRIDPLECINRKLLRKNRLQPMKANC